MYAIRLHQFGEADQLLLDDVAAPGPLPNEILVRVVASGINPIEWKIRRGGHMGQMLGRPLPVTFGWECAGIVTRVGADAHRFAVGDAVFAMLPFDRDGTHAETVAIPAEHAALKPRGLSFSQAAAVPMTAQAAWSAVEAGAISRGGRALVLGATGSVGHWLVQLLKASGVEIVATGPADRLEQVRNLGADTVLDHMNETFETAGPFDAVFDLVGGDAQERSWSVLGPGGKLVSLVEPPDEGRHGATGLFVFTQPRGSVLGELAAMIDSGALRPLPVAIRLPLHNVECAHQIGKSGDVKGKMVIDV